MNSFFKIVLGCFISMLFLAAFLFFKNSFIRNENLPQLKAFTPAIPIHPGVNILKLKTHISAWKQSSKSASYNAAVIFIADMSIPSGKARLLVYNLQNDSIEISGLVTHGSGSITGNGTIRFSNIPGSYCTSAGKYKIGNAYIGRFGLAYKLYGLDKTNDKAFERFVVLHAHDCVPDVEVYPLEICASQGCPTVSPGFLKKLKQYMDASAKPTLLWIYD